MIKELQVLEPPGLAEIKQVEMFTKWRSLLKKENQDVTCPKPTDEVMARIKKSRNEKARANTGNKRKAIIAIA